MSGISERLPAANIRVIASGERACRIKSGVEVNGKKYTFPVYGPDDKSGPADLMIYAVKNHHLARAIGDSKNQIGDETIIMSLLNGVTSEETIARSYGANVLYSIVMGIDATRDGDSTAYSTLGAIQFGEAVNEEGNYSQNVLLVKDFFESAGIPYEILRDMKWALWKKFMLNAGVNQTSAILRCTYGVLHKSPEARDVIRKAMEEVTVVARREGIELTEDDIGDAFSRLGRLSPEGRTSMAQDVEAKRKTEVEIFGAAVVELGVKHGVATPVNELMYKLILAIEGAYM